MTKFDIQADFLSLLVPPKSLLLTVGSQTSSPPSTPSDLAARMAKKIGDPEPESFPIILDPTALKPRRRANKKLVVEVSATAPTPRRRRVSVSMTAEVASRIKALWRDTDLSRLEIALLARVHPARVSEVLNGQRFANVQPMDTRLVQ